MLNCLPITLGCAALLMLAGLGTAFAGMDTFIGPVYLAAGLAEGGNSALYLFIGRLR